MNGSISEESIMAIIKIEIQDIPHGHGLSFKKGVADGLFKCNENEQKVPKSHLKSYERGLKVGAELERGIAQCGGLIYTDTSIDGKSAIRGVLMAKR